LATDVAAYPSGDLSAIGSASDLAIYRAVLNLWGLQGGYCRDPFFPLDANREEALRRFLTKSGWIDPDRILAEIA
jgi:hypothetical protein